jgi:MoxR-like ATPase
MSAPLKENDIAFAHGALTALRTEVGRVIAGPTSTVDLLATALLAQGHVLLEGVPGVAKTTMVKTFAHALGCSSRRIQFTADLLPSDITGTYVLSPRDGTFSFRAGPIFAHVVLADEINRAPAKTQAALLEAMQEKQVTVDGERFVLASPFFVLATQNPIDFEGTYPLPEAQIDRFLIRIRMGYPTAEEELRMLTLHGASMASAPTAASVLSPERVFELQSMASRVHVEESLLAYVIAITTATRRDPRVVLGASPRGTLSMIHAAKAYALLRGRAFVTPDDIRELAPAVLAHRIMLSGEHEGTLDARDNIIREVLKKVSYRGAA